MDPGLLMSLKHVLLVSGTPLDSLGLSPFSSSANSFRKFIGSWESSVLVTLHCVLLSEATGVAWFTFHTIGACSV